MVPTTSAVSACALPSSAVRAANAATARSRRKRRRASRRSTHGCTVAKYARETKNSASATIANTAGPLFSSEPRAPIMSR